MNSRASNVVTHERHRCGTRFDARMKNGSYNMLIIKELPVRHFGERMIRGPCFRASPPFRGVTNEKRGKFVRRGLEFEVFNLGR